MRKHAHSSQSHICCTGYVLPFFIKYILLNNICVGGRFREIYYWDSFWIIEGLLESQLFSIANDTLQNFMDQLDQFGFIPNGGRIYCKAGFFLKWYSADRSFITLEDLNRSQPPLFIQVRPFQSFNLFRRLMICPATDAVTIRPSDE